ncbi:hypothetical protein [Nostoc sp. CHAB 5715]|uniref:hypothetical protein n=1 Tax=Nostoc sp. CHAB 5715 TaxID=2780400 RepID=UPI001E4C618A|nr:hypothetical protein [Nostoc sp. CHAB 5715]MCC5621272.1 hypothetical protein [Nostoc sp. CHAB 5715]
MSIHFLILLPVKLVFIPDTIKGAMCKYSDVYDGLFGDANVVLLPLRKCRDSPLFNHPCSLTRTDPSLPVCSLS